MPVVFHVSNPEFHNWSNKNLHKPDTADKLGKAPDAYNISFLHKLPANQVHLKYDTDVHITNCLQ